MYTLKFVRQELSQFTAPNIKNVIASGVIVANIGIVKKKLNLMEPA